jgi:hypothetical protein
VTCVPVLVGQGLGPPVGRRQFFSLPASGLHEVLRFDRCCCETLHGADDGFAGFSNYLWVVEVGGGDDDGAGSADGLFAFLRIVFDVEGSGALLHEDAGAYEDCFGAELHHQRCVGWGGDAACAEVRYGKLAGFGYHADELVGCAVDLCGVVEFFVTENCEGPYLADDLAHVLDGVDDVTGAGLALGADHGCAFGDAAEGFAEVARAADKGCGEGMLVDVVGLVGGGEDFGLVDEVDAEVLEDLGFGEVADAGLGHDGDGDGADDALDELGVSHAGDTAFGADHGGDALECHDGDGSGLFGDAGLFDVHDVHDDAAFEHLGEAEFEAEGRGAEVSVAVVGVVCHGVLLGSRAAGARAETRCVYLCPQDS